MNYLLLNKKWSSYFNWTILYPTYLFLFLFLGSFFLLISSQLNFTLDKSFDFENWFFGLYFFFILLVALLLPYGIWFIIASDSLAKSLGWNRIVFNIFNLFMIFSMLYFVTVILFWIKVKDKFEDAGYDVSWTGKLKS